MTKKKEILSTSAGNPFSDIQARNYSDTRVLSEFCPIPLFWTLFNDQHEVVIGARGCGKTILFKMMRYSMLNKMSDPRAKKIVEEKNYIALYVPLHLEFIKRLSSFDLSEEKKIAWFRFSFNCALAQSVVIELTELIKDIFPDQLARANAEYELSENIRQLWHLSGATPIRHFAKLRQEVTKLFYGANLHSFNEDELPNPFIHSIASALSSINECVCSYLNISPTWLLCVDEAEFIDECYQRCINTAFRSDTNRIAIKMATLPFYHTTKRTLDEDINVLDGQDFKYTIIEMKPDSPEFINVTNSIVKTRFARENVKIERLSDFVETLGNDQYLDYYTKEVGKEIADQAHIQRSIFSQLSTKSKAHNADKPSDAIRKSVYDKYAPIYYLREMFKKEKGHYVPGWYAGASMIRRMAQGNPRVFIRIMNELYSTASGKALPLTVKAQHRTLEKFARSFCKETQTLEGYGPEAKQALDNIAQMIHVQTHGEKLALTGTTFMLNQKTDVSKHTAWMHKAIAFSRLFVDDDSLKTEISLESKFELSNLYAACYWLPMRNRTPIKILLHDFNSINKKSPKQYAGLSYEQLSLNLDGCD